MGVNCRYSWVPPVVQGACTDESCMVCVDRSDVESVSSFKTHSDDLFGWAEDSDLSDDDDVPNENLPLIAAFPDPHVQPSPEQPLPEPSPVKPPPSDVALLPA